MEARGFEADVTDADGETIVAVRGEVDVYTSPQLRERLDASIDAGKRRVVLDLSGTDFIDSTGIGVIVGALKRLRGEGGELIVRSPNRAAARAFEVTGLTKVLQIEG